MHLLFPSLSLLLKTLISTSKEIERGYDLRLRLRIRLLSATYLFGIDFSLGVVPEQRAKKAVSDCLGLVISILNLPDGQMKFFGGIQITEEL